MKELKIWYLESYEVNENYWVVAESEEEAIKLIRENQQEMGLFWEEYDIDPVDCYDIEKQVITINSCG